MKETTIESLKKEDILKLSFYPEECREALTVCGTKSGRDIDKAAATGLVPVEFDLEENTTHFSPVVPRLEKALASLSEDTGIAPQNG